MATFKLPEPSKDKPPMLTDYQKVQLAIMEINRELRDTSNYFKTVNTCFMALAQYCKVPAKKVAEILANPTVVANYENDVVLELKKISKKKASEVDKLGK